MATAGTYTRARRWVAVATAMVLSAAGPFVGGGTAYADSTRDKQWYLDALRVSQAHAVTQGEGAVVGLVDTGVQPDHPDLAGNILPGIDVVDPANKSKGWVDQAGHGTAMAGLIAGHGHGSGNRSGILGIAPKAKIIPYHVYDVKSASAYQGAIGNSIILATDAGVDVICVAFVSGFEHAMKDAVKYAADHGVLVVAGAGNSPDPIVGLPAAFPGALAVTASDRAGNVATTVRGVPDFEVDVAAPGADIISVRPGGRYASATGTSNSTAIVTGAVALIRSAHPGASRDEVLRRLLWTATDLGEPGYDWTFGWGGLNLLEAVTGIPRPPATATPAPTRSVTRPEVVSYPPADNTGAELLGLALVTTAGVLVTGIVLAIVIPIRRRRRRVSAAAQSTSDVSTPWS